MIYRVTTNHYGGGVLPCSPFQNRKSCGVA